MKKLINSLLYASLFMVALSFTSCQEEFEEVGGDEQETLMAGSNTADLIVKTSSNDGSFDNIVDGASCIAVKFPYTVDVGGIQITIDSREDLHLIEEIFDEFDDDQDILEFIFPITITLGDFTEVVIENKQQLRELAEECREGGEDDDIECIDFVYPITLFTFDINEQQTGTVVVESDKDMRRFFEGLGENDLIGIDFPVTLKKYDGTEIVVDSNAELAMALEAAKDECDEDDDNDYNDDDFDEERFVNFLTECPWEVREIIRTNVDQTQDFFEYVLDFNQEGGVTLEDGFGNVAEGEWSVEFTEYGPLLELAFPEYEIFNVKWLVYEIGDGKIKLYIDDGSKVILKNKCGDDENDDPNTLREILKECEWVIKKVKNQGEEIDRLLGYEFKFMAEGVVTLSNGENTSEGSWEIGYNSEQVISLLITFGDEPAVNFEWPLRDLANDRLKFEVDEIGYELVLQRVCDDNANDGDVVEIRSVLMEGDWAVALYEEGEVNTTAEFAGFTFNFVANHLVVATLGDMGPATPGLWRVLRNSEGELKVYLNFGGDHDPLSELTDDWYFESVTDTRIELQSESGDGTLETLVFERL